ncbi:MAG: septum formation protein Maf [Clostridia bacterium]|nr:septum formation protein Maf [Clostridia bacterium]
MIILASASPRRRELLGYIAPEFEVRPTGCDESCGRTDGEGRVLELSMRKALAAREHAAAGDAVIAADTVVELDGEILEKPRDREDALRMLHALSGRTHTVCTGVAMCFRGKTYSFCEKTRVTFCRLREEQLVAYVDSGEPMDKAGAYGMQGAGSFMVERVEGDPYNVIGLPVCALNRLLWDVGALGG